MTYAEYHQKLKNYKESQSVGRGLIERPNIKDVDLNTVPPAKRGIIEELQNRELC